MRIIDNLIIINLNNDKGDVLFVNGINGCVDIIHKREFEIIKRWKDAKTIIAVDDFEKGLIENLLRRQYILDLEEETTIKNNIIKKLKENYNLSSKNSKAAYFVLTYNCNFACPYCYEKGINDSKILTKEMVDKVFADNPDLEHIGLFGGEPFLLSNKGIIEYIFKKAPNLSYSAITNGYYLQEYISLLKSVNFLNIQVTLDGSEKKHNKTRMLRNGKPTYQKIIAGIRNCIENNIHITIRMNISPENIEDCLNEKAQIESTEWGHKVAFELQPLFQCQSDIRANLYCSLFENDLDAKNISNDMLRKLMPISNFLYNGTKLRPILKSCDREGQYKYYDANGDIYNCILAVGNKNKSIGTFYPDLVLKKDSFVTRDITTIEECKKCPNSLLCGGGCPNGLTNFENIYTPNCYSFYNDLKYTVPLVYKYKYGSEK